LRGLVATLHAACPYEIAQFWSPNALLPSFGVAKMPVRVADARLTLELTTGFNAIERGELSGVVRCLGSDCDVLAVVNISSLQNLKMAESPPDESFETPAVSDVSSSVKLSPDVDVFKKDHVRDFVISNVVGASPSCK
jgi:hypothetical protein